MHMVTDLGVNQVFPRSHQQEVFCPRFEGCFVQGKYSWTEGNNSPALEFSIGERGG